MTTLATLLVRITADTTDYQTKLKAVSEIGNKLTSVGSKLSKAVTLPLVALGTYSVMAASNLNESMSKVQVVFGKSAKVVQDFASTSAKNLGMSGRAALEASGSFGNLFVTLGLGQSDAAGMSTELVKLAADLASFNNLNPEEVLLKLRSGLVGETEPLRSLGVNLTAAGVTAKAMEMGLAGANGQVSQSAMVQARYALILEQTKTAQGDFARTADGMANKLRTAKAQIEDSAAALGTKLLPYAIQAVDFVTKLVTAFSNLPVPVQNTVVAIAALAAAMGPMLSISGKLISGGASLIGFFGKLPASVVASLGPLALIAGALIAVGVAFKGLNDKTEAGIKQVETAWGNYFKKQISQGKTATEIAAAYNQKTGEVNKVFNDQHDLLGKVAVGWVKLTKDESRFLEDQEGLQQALLETSNSFDEYWKSIVVASGGSAEAADQGNFLTDMIKEQAQATWDAAHPVEELANTMGTYTDSVTMAYLEQDRLTQANITSTNALEQEKRAALEAASAIQSDLAGAVESLQRAQESWSLSVANSAVSAIESTKGLSEEQIRILKAATDSVMGSTFTATDNMNAALATAVANFAKTGDVAQYQADIQQVAADFETTLAPDVKVAQDAVDNLQHALDLLNNKPINIPVSVTVEYPNGGIPGVGGTTSTPGAGTTSSGGGGGGGPPVAELYATGGGGVVPPGYPNDSYLIGLTSGETFTVTPPGGSPGEAVVITQNFYGNAEPETVKIAARDGVLAAQRAKGVR